MLIIDIFRIIEFFIIAIIQYLVARAINLLLRKLILFARFDLSANTIYKPNNDLCLLSTIRIMSPFIIYWCLFQSKR